MRLGVLEAQMRAGVIGAGRSGIAAARLLQKLGAQVLLSERGRAKIKPPMGVDLEVGQHSSRLLQSDVVIRSPGVPGHLPILKKIERRGIPVWSELELAGRYLRFRDLVAITGTNGKTTTTTLVGEFFKSAGRRTRVGGNIGTPPSAFALKTSPRSSIVLEVSSYQLEDVHVFHPTLSAILNITPDHLEHHGTMQAYAAAKARIFENQTPKDVCVLNADDLWCRRLAKRCRANIFWFSRKKKLREGVFIDGGQIVIRWRNCQQRWRLETHLPGPHNVENILAAVALAVAGGISSSVIRRVLRAFRGVEHRLEWVRTLRGVRYINDSKATNVDSTRVALASFDDPLVVILGGQGKRSPYAPLIPLIKNHVKRVLLIGEDAPTIERQLRGTAPMERQYTMGKAVHRAATLAQPGDVVLLSPACASFDQYNNYEERGRHFKNVVQKLS
jgi:UDP-N-acetylmuramoylalanine--D-glutamate ligase